MKNENQMKPANQWLAQYCFSLKGVTPETIREIQRDALQFAAELCSTQSEEGEDHEIGLINNGVFRCADKIKEEIAKLNPRSYAMETREECPVCGHKLEYQPGKQPFCPNHPH